MSPKVIYWRREQESNLRVAIDGRCRNRAHKLYCHLSVVARSDSSRQLTSFDDAASTELAPSVVVPMRGFEPPTFGLSVRRLYPLGYIGKRSGAAPGIRTLILRSLSPAPLPVGPERRGGDGRHRTLRERFGLTWQVYNLSRLHSGLHPRVVESVAEGRGVEPPAKCRPGFQDQLPAHPAVPS